MRLHAFNPDTDYALAIDKPYYTPPAHVRGLRMEQALLPVLYAEKGDAVLLLDKPFSTIESMKFFRLAVKKGIEIVDRKDVAAQRERFSEYRPDPWGWNRCMRQTFLDLVGEMPGLPTANQIAEIRELSHRRTTILFFEEMSDLLDPEITTPTELTDAEEGMRRWHKDKNLFFKAPWSSSGRGIMLADDQMPMHIEPWLRGIINRQGSAMMENAYRRKLDFATEWLIDDESEPRFLGYSVFNVSRRGKYHGNIRGSQDRLLKTIKHAAPAWDDYWLERQRDAICKIIASKYRGPLGIDMLVTCNGAINPCVEINLRRTMGMLHIK